MSERTERTEPVGEDGIDERRSASVESIVATPRVSVVIPVYNGEATIERCLESILTQRAPFAFEVVVADSSTDRTPEIIASSFPSVRLVRLERPTYPGTARNAAIRVARAPLIAMTDADCIASPDMLARMVARHDVGDYAAVGGAICDGTPGDASGLVGYLLEFREFMPTAPAREVATIATANICYRREVFDRFGYFDDVRASEDMLFNWRITDSGLKIFFDPAIRVTHVNRTGWPRVLAYQEVLGANSARARRMRATRLERSTPGELRERTGDATPSTRLSERLFAFVVHHPSLVMYLAPLRLARALAWLLRYDPKTFLKLAVYAPKYFVGAVRWSRAFGRALRQTDVNETAPDA